MNLKLLRFLFLVSFFPCLNCFNVFSKDVKPEDIFLKNLIQLNEIYGDRPLPSTYEKTENTKFNEEAEHGHGNEKRSEYINLIIDLAKKRKESESDERLSDYLKKEKALTPAKLLNYFNEKKTGESFSIKNGDIVMILPLTFSAYQYAYVMESSYEHIDLIYVKDSGAPFVLELSRHSDIREIPLSRYLLGSGSPNSRFLILRHISPLKDEIADRFFKVLLKNKNNIYYDKMFVRNTLIENPEVFFNEPRFFYCGELVYAFYEYLTGGIQFHSNFNISLRRMTENRGWFDFSGMDVILKYFDILEKEENQYMIIPQTFSKSKTFIKIASMGDDVTIRGLVNSAKNDSEYTQKEYPSE